MPPEQAIAAATGNNARVYRLNSGFLQAGKDADVVLIDACAGGSKDNALDALATATSRQCRRLHGRHAPLCRTQPQHAGRHPQRARRGMPAAA